MLGGPSITAGADGGLRIELPPSRLMMRVGLALEVAFTGFAALALFAPARDVPTAWVVLPWAAAFMVIELLRFGRQELVWEPQRRLLRRRLLTKHGALPFSQRQWNPGPAARTWVEAGRGGTEAGFWIVFLAVSPAAPPARLFWSPEKAGAETITARLAEAIAAPR